MFLTVHGAIGIIIGQRISNPWLAFIAGFILHYIFDIIPHGDTKVPKQYYNIVYASLAGIIDLIIFAIFLIFISSKVEILKLNIILAIIGSLLPDILQAFYFISRQKLFKSFQNVHDYFHGLISNRFEFNFFTGLFLQIIFFIILIIII